MNKGYRYRSQGAALVEFAIVAPLLAILLLGLTEFGHALYQHNTLEKAVASGARYVARNYQGIPVADDCDITDSEWSTAISRAKQIISYGSVAPSSVGLDHMNPDLPNLDPDDITITLRDDGGVCVVRVVADVEYSSIFSTIFELTLPSMLFADAEERFIGE